LRLEISCDSDKKKMNLIFNFDKKILLTGKTSTRVGLKTKTDVEKFRASQSAIIPNPCDDQTSVLIPRACPVDRIGLCTQFPASASRGQTLSKL